MTIAQNPSKYFASIITYKHVMDNFSIGLVTAARAGVKTGLAVYIAELE